MPTFLRWDIKTIRKIWDQNTKRRFVFYLKKIINFVILWKKKFLT